jgi:multidrug efflux pump subunit AcrA (membrane-fusion protein)
MGRGVVWWITTMVAALAVGVAAGRDLSAGAPTAPRLAARPPAAQATAAAASPGPRRTPVLPLVAVARPQRAAVPVTLSLTGSIASLRTAVLYSKVAGYLQAVAVRPGDPVAAGQVVAVVDHAQLETQVAQAQASALAAATAVQTARDAVATARAQYANAAAGRESAARRSRTPRPAWRKRRRR